MLLLVGDPPLTKKHRRKSAIWKYFNTCDDDVTKVVCNICKRVVSRGKDLGHLLPGRCTTICIINITM